MLLGVAEFSLLLAVNKRPIIGYNEWHNFKPCVMGGKLHEKNMILTREDLKRMGVLIGNFEKNS